MKYRWTKRWICFAVGMLLGHLVSKAYFVEPVSDQIPIPCIDKKVVGSFPPYVKPELRVIPAGELTAVWESQDACDGTYCID